MESNRIITSVNNSQIKAIKQLLTKAKERRKQGLYVVEGLKMFEEAFDEELIIKTYVSESFFKNKTVEEAEVFQALDYEILSDSLFKNISDTVTPQGIMGIVKSQEYDIMDLLRGEDTFLLILEDIRDPGNLGTMVRTAEAAGVTGIIMNSSCVDLYNPKVIRSTMGSIFRLPVYITENLTDTLMEIKSKKITIYAAHLDGKPYGNQIFNGKIAILIGNEANGLSQENSKMTDKKIKIPMKGKVESLNAAVASSILMYEAARQRGI